jgi:hypothetical protein
MFLVSLKILWISLDIFLILVMYLGHEEVRWIGKFRAYEIEAIPEVI